MPFETPVTIPGILTGTIGAVVLAEGVGGATPSTIIKSTTPFTVSVNWAIDGLISPMFAGTWIVRIFAESIGPGPEVALTPPAGIPINLAVDPTAPRNYSAAQLVPAGTLLPGTYRLVTTVTYNLLSPPNPPGTPGPMAGFQEGPIIQVYAA